MGSPDWARKTCLGIFETTFLPVIPYGNFFLFVSSADQYQIEHMEEHKGKTAIVTGAGWGIGYAISEALAKNGARVILNDIDPERAQAACDKINRMCSEISCIAVPGDAGDLKIIDQMTETAMNEFGGLDYAVANAGITTFGSFLEYKVEDFQTLVHLNLQGSFFLCQRAAKVMIEQKTRGRILLMSSVTGYQGHHGLSGYGMTKAAIRFFARLVGVELAPYGLTVNAIAPGATMTERTLEDPHYRDTWQMLNPTGIVNEPEDIAHTALFLLSEKSRQINGQTIVVDGGWTATSPSPDQSS